MIKFLFFQPFYLFTALIGEAPKMKGNSHAKLFRKNDEILVELSLLGDDSAYAELVSRHQRAVMGTAYKVTENTFSAEDASQDAFVSA